MLKNIEIEKIKPSPLNRKVIVESAAFDSFVKSIDEEGLIQPIVVRPEGDGFEIVCGERRYRACLKLGWETIPAIVEEIDECKAHTRRIIENLQREDVPPLEQAEGVAHLLAEHGDNAKEVAVRLGVSENWVYLRSRLSNLSQKWREELSKEETDFEEIKNRVTFQQELAKLPEATQDMLLDLRELLHCRNLEILQERIGRFLYRLADAPWPEKLFKNCCKDCDARSDAAGNKPLFAEYVNSDDAVCLDPDCWDAKIRFWLKKEFAKLLKKDKNAIMLYVGYLDPQKRNSFEGLANRIFPMHNWRISLDKPDDEDDVVETKALFIDGENIGEVFPVWIENEYEDDEDREGEPSEDEKSAEEKAEELANKISRERLNAMVNKLSELVWDEEEKAAYFPLPPDASLIWLAANGCVVDDYTIIDTDKDPYLFSIERSRGQLWDMVCNTIKDELTVRDFVTNTEEKVKRFIAKISATEDVRKHLESECLKAAETAEVSFLESCGDR